MDGLSENEREELYFAKLIKWLLVSTLQFRSRKLTTFDGLLSWLIAKIPVLNFLPIHKFLSNDQSLEQEGYIISKMFLLCNIIFEFWPLHNENICHHQKQWNVKPATNAKKNIWNGGKKWEYDGVDVFPCPSTPRRDYNGFEAIAAPTTITKIVFKKGDALYTRFFRNLSRYKVNCGTPSMQPCMIPFERTLHLKVFGKVLLSPFEF